MLRKILSLAITAVIAKKAWDQYKASQPTAGVEPMATPEDLDSSAASAQPVPPESPMQYH